MPLLNADSVPRAVWEELHHVSNMVIEELLCGWHQSWHWGQTLLFEQSGQEAGKHTTCQAEGKVGKKHDEVRSTVWRGGVLGYTR